MHPSSKSHLHLLKMMGESHVEKCLEPVELTPEELADEVYRALSRALQEGIVVPAVDMDALIREETLVLLTLPRRETGRDAMVGAYRTNASRRIRHFLQKRKLQRTGLTQQRRYLRDERQRGETVKVMRLPARLLRNGKN